MSKAKEQALKAYPNIKIGKQHIDQSPAREVYVQGYEQAQQDFIEKTVSYLKENLLRYIDLCERGVGISTEEFIDDFKEYMKGE